MFLNFNKESFCPEDFEILLNRPAGRVFTALEQLHRHFAGDTGRGANQAFVKLGKNFLIDTRTVVKTLGISDTA